MDKKKSRAKKLKLPPIQSCSSKFRFYLVLLSEQHCKGGKYGDTSHGEQLPLVVTTCLNYF